ncbi:MAG: hypothetical protein GTN62_01455 [Gemmatimonadales bacterium]|nr:hypothetical protein [Gemmatimonadales bacterium]NIN48769.1 hypothetical protein [Gemmatimonadales bacterium]NIP06233.1 hypothetical protein [Gemmatimonadales bacterium]NIS65318.1 hypothetical protein [Gemmatimonadales bacterium]
MSRRIMALLAVALLATTMFAPGAAAQDPVFVFVFADGATVEVDEGDEIILVYGWAAKTKGQVRMAQSAIEDSFLVEDAAGTEIVNLSVEEADEYWNPLETIATVDLGINCKKAEFWVSVWTYSLGTLPAGTYTLYSSTTFDHPVNDGYHNCEEVDAPSLYPASEYGTAVVTIVVG